MKKQKVSLPRSGTALAAKMRRAGRMRSKQDRRAKDARKSWRNDGSED